MGIQLEVDPARLTSLRTRLSMPRQAGAKRARVSESQLADWESDRTALPVETLQRLARAYNRNWYVFLLKDEVGKPAIPRDFRRKRTGPAKLSAESLLAFDTASLLLDKIGSLSDPASELEVIRSNRARLSDSAEAVAGRFRKTLAVDSAAQTEPPDSYATLRFWVDTLTQAGLYVSQVSMPTDEVRAFCLSQGGNHLIVLSNADYPTARTFSLLHEVAHLLLGTDAMCQPDEIPPDHHDGHEPWCNRFAAAVLMPRSVLEENAKFRELIDRDIRIGSGRSLAKDLGVSELALFRRLETLGHISAAQYQQLQAEADRQWKENPNQQSTGFLIYPKKVVSKETPLFVRQVLDAYSKGDIAYREIATLLDTPLRSIPQIREVVA